LLIQVSELFVEAARAMIGGTGLERYAWDTSRSRPRLDNPDQLTSDALSLGRGANYKLAEVAIFLPRKVLSDAG
jgi:hypothetical protein